MCLMYEKTYRKKGRGENMVSEWNPGEKMTREFALTALNEICCFHRRLYFFPNKRPFNSKEEFEGSMQILNGLKELIKTTE